MAKQREQADDLAALVVPKPIHPSDFSFASESLKLTLFGIRSAINDKARGEIDQYTIATLARQRLDEGLLTKELRETAEKAAEASRLDRQLEREIQAAELERAGHLDQRPTEETLRAVANVDEKIRTLTERRATIASGLAELRRSADAAAVEIRRAVAQATEDATDDLRRRYAAEADSAWAGLADTLVQTRATLARWFVANHCEFLVRDSRLKATDALLRELAVPSAEEAAAAESKAAKATDDEDFLAAAARELNERNAQFERGRKGVSVA